MNIKFSKLFDWSIKSVDEPKYYFDEKKMEECYLVRVTYNHHGIKKVPFYITEVIFITCDTPRFKAEQYYTKMKNKMQKQK